MSKEIAKHWFEIAQDSEDAFLDELQREQSLVRIARELYERGKIYIHLHLGVWASGGDLRYEQICARFKVIPHGETNEHAISEAVSDRCWPLRPDFSTKQQPMFVLVGETLELGERGPVTEIRLVVIQDDAVLGSETQDSSPVSPREGTLDVRDDRKLRTRPIFPPVMPNEFISEVVEYRPKVVNRVPCNNTPARREFGQVHELAAKAAAIGIKGGFDKYRLTFPPDLLVEEVEMLLSPVKLGQASSKRVTHGA